MNFFRPVFPVFLAAVVLAGCSTGGWQSSAADEKNFEELTVCEQLSQLSASPYATPVQMETIMRRAEEEGCLDGNGWS